MRSISTMAQVNGTFTEDVTSSKRPRTASRSPISEQGRCTRSSDIMPPQKWYPKTDSLLSSARYEDLRKRVVKDVGNQGSKNNVRFGPYFEFLEELQEFFYQFALKVRKQEQKLSKLKVMAQDIRSVIY
ncbi:hypothetical protein QCA50_008328 [Cerrena zonata]|uniref:Uncharacterized protein n=1 Tax=Cerrena zonata TaxID=2478898 RepID=A0AAW0GF91_9APHY